MAIIRFAEEKRGVDSRSEEKRETEGRINSDNKNERDIQSVRSIIRALSPPLMAGPRSLPVAFISVVRRGNVRGRRRRSLLSSRSRDLFIYLRDSPSPHSPRPSTIRADMMDNKIYRALKSNNRSRVRRKKSAARRKRRVRGRFYARLSLAPS